MKVEQTELSGVLILHPPVFEDARGGFMETWNRARYEQIGIRESFVQDNLSWSRQGALRGLHFQNPGAQGKLVSVLAGAVFDVAVDLRRDSLTLGKWFGLELSSENHLQLYVPEGFAHGFQVLSDSALFHYKCTAPYQPENEHTLAFDSPEVGIAWPLKERIVSAKDQKGLSFEGVAARYLFEPTEA